MSALPSLLFPVDVTFRPIAKTTTRYDPIRREPVNTVSRAANYTIKGQVVWADPNQVQANTPVAHEAGITEQRLGYIVLRRVDLEAQSVMPARGDEIIQVAVETVNLFVERVTFHDHRNGNFQLAKAYFTERRSEGNG